ncbi:MAG: PA2169 family four-helix-bundle protein [Planctomycetales bacterium]|nr:PA2169 family four-helix-bundle protein [Planctomycetales bacterium]MBN8626867.1 PA2169 family four-helix-bundle protein [Planctomycetota bacterium]
MNTTFSNLPEKSLDWLQDLIEINIDSSKGFKEAADNLQDMKEKDLPLESMFRSLSADRARQADELQAIVASNAKKPTESGSVAAAAHRTWMDLRTALGGGQQAVLSEAERGEDHIKAKYEEALQELGSCPCTQVLRRHYDAVKASHDKVRDLRDAHAKV